MIKLELQGDYIYLKCEYGDKDKCHAIGTGRWSKVHDRWEFPRDAITTIAEVFKGQKFHASQEVLDLLTSLRYRNTLLDNIKDKKQELPEHPFLMYHQKQCKLIAGYFPKFAFFLDTGTGKTIASAEIIQDKACKFLVICPKTIIKSAWVEDLEKFYPFMRLLPLSRNMSKEDYLDLYTKWGVTLPFNNNKDNLKVELTNHAHTYIINPESFKLDSEEISTYGIQGLIVDESVIIKNPQSQITKEITRFADTMEYVYILSGMPAPNGQMDYFSQMRIVDPAILGNSFFSFRQRYFHPVGYMGYNWEINEDVEEDLARRISTKSISIRKEDCLDLPEKTYLRHIVELPDDARKIYKTMEKQQLAILTDTSEAILATNKIASMMKLRQISSGFILNEGEVSTIHDAKFNTLFDILEEIGDKQVIIWCQFKHEIKIIEKELLDGDYKTVTAYSDTKDTDESIRMFKYGEAQYMVAHPASLKYGVTFTGCSYAIYYSKSYDLNEYKQSHDRIYRKGQEVPCTFIDIIVEKTIDEDIDKCVKDKGDVAGVIEGIIRRNS